MSFPVYELKKRNIQPISCALPLFVNEINLTYMNPLVVVCISTFNRFHDLQKCISSVMEQDYENLKIVIYDNVSSDDTQKLMAAYEVWFPGIVHTIYGEEPEPNAMVTLNETFWKAKDLGAKYILVMDDDGYLATEDVISKLVASMVDWCAIVGANVKSEDGMWQMPVRRSDGYFLTPEEIDKVNLFGYFEFHGCCALFDVEKCSKLGFYDESFGIYMNELDMATRALAAGYMVLIRTDAVAYHRGVGDRNACTDRAYYFIRNYNTVLTRNFRTVIGRLKAVTLHTFMSGGYYAERILIHNTCNNRWKIFKFSYYMAKIIILALYRSFFPDQKLKYPDQELFEKSMYNGFKRCIKDRMKWIKGREYTSTKGVR